MNSKKKLFISTFLITLFCFISFSQPLKKVKKFGKNPGGLKMYIHTPKINSFIKKKPLVIVLHGCTQTANGIAAATGWNTLADTLGFVVLYPEQRLMNNVSKCFNFFIGMKAKKDKGEVSSIKNMINYSINEYNIDPSKIFITGVSAGGGMSNALLNAYPELFNAAALIGSPSTLVNDNNITAKHIPRIAIIQGKNDKIVSHKASEKLLNQWIAKNNFDNNNFTTTENFMNNELINAKSFYTDENILKIIMLTIKNVGHKILIDPGKNINQGGKIGIYTKDINFHSTYWIADFWGITN